ncbi:beta-ketoacyl synthase N-terminal-like domain-containing protein [Bdellovibrio sp. HCB185ZH]|uniref:beta-ketoacyl synthase N-terminal-like domain-containing protein n=1 Tax=Bdellovibrio sp. HCB185ZH TaxID=3394235 RepID=UPI0039A52F74
MYIQNYSCTTAAGFGTRALMSALYSGKDCSIPAENGGRVCYLEQNPEKAQTYKNIFVNAFKDLIHPVREGLSKNAHGDITKSRAALIFASTKGCLEDFIWEATSENIREMQDPFTSIYQEFTEAMGDLEWTLHCNISNACASSHVALEYAQDLFMADRVEYALIIAGDLIGPFVYKGFQSLKVISPTGNRPFSGDREGLQLGEAMAMLLLSKERKSPNDLKVTGVASDTEGSSITRPSLNGQGLLRAIEKANAQSAIQPDLVIAHGTGTKFNDSAEEQALAKFLGTIQKADTPITNTKWSIGHTLGASGLIDVIAACEILKTQKAFRIQNTLTKESAFTGNYLTAQSDVEQYRKFRQILVTSLGFGGIHAACAISSEENYEAHN